MKPLFIPLKREFFEAFSRGEKTHEYRLYGRRWNERTCVPGRAVVLSLGYGRQRRIAGFVKSFGRTAPSPAMLAAWKRCYGDCPEMPVADIEIELVKENL